MKNAVDPQPTDRASGGLLGRTLGAVGAAALLTIITAIQCHGEDARYVLHPLWMPHILYGAVLWFWWAGVWFGLWSAGRRWPKLWRVSPPNGLLQLLLSAGIAFGHLAVLQATAHFMLFHWAYLKTVGYHVFVSLSTERVSIEVLLYVILWAACAAAHLQVARQTEALRIAELKQQLSSAHLRALQMQLKPHFLFNTLNAITALVEFGRQKEAVNTLSHLNAILRSTLGRDVPEKVPLAQELSVVENYLAIERVRFADRLRVELAVDSSALNSMVPCFLLQPIVENAIRHGISQVEDEGVVRTSIERSGDLLRISVCDNGPGLGSKSNHNGHGIGLRSTEDRLAHFYPKRYAFSSGKSALGGFEVTMTIPYEPAAV